ncbi:MAG: DNA replication and repair protein RecF [Cellvibrionales bacterium]|nr:DNA replication and repair protein RecF [Cellvibrionales bacterium]
MRITELELAQLRNIERATLETDSPTVLIGGPNAAGKTTLLEGIYLLLAGRSFRTREATKLIRTGHQNCWATARIGEAFLGASRSADGRPVHRLNAADLSLAELVRHFPVMLLDNSVFALFEGPPQYRRQLIDWGLFHVKHAFYSQWRHYRHALKQRNALLKNASPDPAQIDVWDAKLAPSGECIDRWRTAYIADLSTHCEQSPLLDGLNLEFSYARGWAGETTLPFAAALRQARQRDIRQRHTGLGPQHADLRITVTEAGKAGDRLSRGQKKLAAFAVKLEQLRMYNRQSPAPAFLLVDDIAAELDTDTQRCILRYIETLGSQVFMTSIEPERLAALLSPTVQAQARMFHVKHGCLVQPAHSNP